MSSLVDDSKPRFAVVVSKKVASKAVLRNKLRRRVQHVLGDLASGVTGNLSILIFLKKEAVTLTFSAMRVEIAQLFSKAGLM